MDAAYRQAIEDLIDADAFFLAIKKNRYPMGWGGELYLSRNRLDADQVSDRAEHNAGLGIEPASLGFAVLDLDGDRNTPPARERIARTAARIARKFGEPAFWQFSNSGPEGGKRHLWYRVARGEAPIGRRPDTGMPRKAGSGKEYAHKRGPGRMAVVDIKCVHGYIEFPRDRERKRAYICALAEAVRAKRGAQPRGGWDALFDWLLRYHRTDPATGEIAIPEKREIAPPSPADRERVDPKRLAERNQSTVARHADWSAGERTNSANRLGWIAGKESTWNPELRALALASVPPSDDGTGDYYARAFEKAYRDGCAQAEGPPEWLLSKGKREKAAAARSAEYRALWKRKFGKG